MRDILVANKIVKKCKGLKAIPCISFLFILLFSACKSDDTDLPIDNEVQGNVTFLFTAGSELDTRTTLNSSDNLQHVEKVFLYVFSGTGDRASYVQTREIPWPAPGDVGYLTTSRSFTVSLGPGAYTFLAIGSDDNSGTTYNLPGAITAGTTLSAAKAILASGKTKTDIARSELFAGYAVVSDVEANGSTTVPVKLWRRVAGVIGWFKNIPYKLPFLSTGTQVKKMTIELYTNQNKTIALKKAASNDYGENPFVANENAMNNKIILEYDLSGYMQAAGKNYYDVTAVNANNQLQAGSYILPVKAPDLVSGGTLILRYYDETGTEISGTSRIIQLQSSTPNGGGTTILNTAVFSLEANQLYGMGTKDVPVDLDPGTGDDIVITVNPMWEGISDDIPLE